MKLRWNHAAGLLLIALTLAVPVLEGIFVPAGPLDRIIVIEESGQRTPAVANVLASPTARAAIAAGKWRLWDHNSVPDSELLKIASAGQSGDQWRPWLILQRGGRAVWNGPLPATESDFASCVAAEGGL